MERASGAQLACISTVTGGQGPKARSHTSLGRSPRNQAESEARAESPIHKLVVQQSLQVALYAGLTTGIFLSQFEFILGVV